MKWGTKLAVAAGFVGTVALATALGGRISVESEEDVGTTFRVWLLARVDA